MGEGDKQGTGVCIRSELTGHMAKADSFYRTRTIGPRIHAGVPVACFASLRIDTHVPPVIGTTAAIFRSYSAFVWLQSSSDVPCAAQWVNIPCVRVAFISGA
jgi:hypothetical protein